MLMLMLIIPLTFSLTTNSHTAAILILLESVSVNKTFENLSYKPLIPFDNEVRQKDVRFSLPFMYSLILSFFEFIAFAEFHWISSRESSVFVSVEDCLMHLKIHKYEKHINTRTFFLSSPTKIWKSFVSLNLLKLVLLTSCILTGF